MIKNRDKKIENVLKNFGNHLRTIRKSKGLSQSELSHKADLSKNMVGNIERGEVNPTLTTVMALADGLGITKSEIMSFN